MDDVAAIRACQAGDRDAFRFLVERYQREALGHALALVGNREDARDAVQEAFLDAFRAVATLDAARPFYPWLYVLLRNRCYKLLAGRKRRHAESLPAEPLLAVPAPERAGEVGALEEALGRLSAEDRELITLKHLDGLSYEQLAQRLAVPPGTVMSRLYHARRRLRDRLAEQGGSTAWVEEDA
jgi:RNA polymerase sigma-70 factor (ECF subfamily)